MIIPVVAQALVAAVSSYQTTLEHTLWITPPPPAGQAYLRTLPFELAPQTVIESPREPGFMEYLLGLKAVQVTGIVTPVPPPGPVPTQPLEQQVSVQIAEGTEGSAGLHRHVAPTFKPRSYAQRKIPSPRSPLRKNLPAGYSHWHCFLK